MDFKSNRPVKFGCLKMDLHFAEFPHLGRITSLTKLRFRHFLKMLFCILITANTLKNLKNVI